MIEARAVGYRTREGHHLVRGIDLDLRGGRLYAVAGPNGAGKSTLLRLLSGDLRPSAGEVLIDGRPVGAIAPHELAAWRAVLGQAPGLALPFRVAEVVRLGVDGIGRGFNERARAAVAADAMERAGVARHAGRLVDTLSGGERQRVHFARVLAQLAAGASLERPQALLLDEPIAALDLRHQLALLEEVRRIADAGTLVVAVLHDLQLASAYADEVVLLDGGRVSAVGAGADVFSRARLARVFSVDLLDEVLPPTPWRALDIKVEHASGAQGAGASACPEPDVLNGR
ncbi:MAG TPA: heme ABC transporter ATP-binding protein [Salinarimonas sp.]|nr:heme ABC transporter ATP-binding protein [Salinarimonas sp.]